ncbi:CehA/McbA family metallohydrolase [Pontibacter sp. SGAir0037]|uniref:CehA/McbA family metallohydrolase n=1 Tax=Pontibacter sp. SGAir0037 TaxID=2571030 RepID=UPI0010CD0254|nr:CehA/McbA family metallohydrolase [Pontibacter sp. SGAir0037]QCR24478.1 phosphoesterase [Pontibacter sp. SGAir0037]
MLSIKVLHAQDTLKVNLSGFIPAKGLFKLVYVPFTVPEGVTEIRVKETYSDKGKNVLNLGIYGPEGFELGNTAGFRGWSGGAKTEFFMNASEASTGYVAGKIKAGIWNILIYPSTITAEGINWQLDVILVKGVNKAPFKISPAPETVNNKPGWYRGDLHMHTFHSDGKRSQQKLLQEAKANGLDFIVSTEHNTNSANLSWGQYKTDKLLVINGEEVTTTAFGHWNAIGLSPTSWIEWRYTPEDNMIGTYLNQVKADGGLAIINHPFYNEERINSFGFDADLFDGIEVWNGHAKWNQLDELALEWWDSLLRQGKRKIAIAASDSHTPELSDNPVGSPHTVVQAEALSRKEIMAGLRAGKAYLAQGKETTLTFTAKAGAVTAGIGNELATSPGKEVHVSLAVTGTPDAFTATLVGDKGILASEKATGSNPTFSWRIAAGATKYLRVEVRDLKGDMVALTNPIWLL